MSSHTRGPRKRSRKPRPAGVEAARKAGTAAPARSDSGRSQEVRAAADRSHAKRRKQSRREAPTPVQRTFGERPHAPWHPLPLSEVLILAGGIGAAIGLRRGFHGGPVLVLAGLAAMALGTLEVTLREHCAGYRSHTLLLSFLPVVIFHSLAVLIVAAFTSPPAWLNLVLLAADVAIFLALFRLWRARFLDARARAAARR